MEPDIYTLIISLVFLAFTMSLIRSIRKGSPAKRAQQIPPNSVSKKSAQIPPSSLTHTPAMTPASKLADKQQHRLVSVTQIESKADQNALIAVFKRIPKEVFELLWFSNGPFQNYKQDFTDWDLGAVGEFIDIESVHTCEPSAIDIDLPLSPHFEFPTPLDYYPSYESLTPQQRTAYLNWLVDITVPIDIGYVFIFYYGLERHLFFGNSIAALAAIFILREFHENKSFQAYSEDAILLHALIHGEYSVLQHLDIQHLSPDSRLFVSAMSQHCLTPQDIMIAHKKFSFENTRYIKAESKLFLATLEDKLFEKTGQREFEVGMDDFKSAKGTFTLALANYSLLPAQRFLSLPDISTAPRIHSFINSLLIETHESVKVKLRERRKQAKNI